MSLSHFAPDIEQKLEFSAISTFLVKHGLLALDVCYEDYIKPLHMGIMSNKTVVWKLLPILEKYPDKFYLALSESANNPNQEVHNHLELLRLLSPKMGESQCSALKGRTRASSESAKDCKDKLSNPQLYPSTTVRTEEGHSDNIDVYKQEFYNLQSQLNSCRKEVKSLQEKLYKEQSKKSTCGVPEHKLKVKKGTVPLIALTSRQYKVMWTKLADIPDPLYAARIAKQDEKLYVTGHCSPVENARDNVYAYDITNDHWIKLPPPGHYYGTPIIIGGKLTVIGGIRSGTQIRTNRVSSFEEATGKWISVYQNLNFPRSKPGVVTHLEYVIVAGGAGGESIEQDTIRNDIEVCNWVENTSWRTVITLLPIRMVSLPICISEGQLFIVSYYNDQKQPSDDVYKLSVANILSQIGEPASWTKVTNVHYDTALVSDLYFPMAVGGHASSGAPTRHIKMYNANTCSWHTVGSLLSPRTAAAATAIADNALIVVGGCSEVANEKSALKSVELGQVELDTS